MGLWPCVCMADGVYLDFGIPVKYPLLLFVSVNIVFKSSEIGMSPHFDLSTRRAPKENVIRWHVYISQLSTTCAGTTATK